MKTDHKLCCLLLLISMLNTTDLFAQSPANTQIVSTGFGENLSTGCPRLQVIGDMLYAPGPDGIMRHAKGDNAQWEPFAMTGINVIDFRLSGDEIIAIIVPEEYSNITNMDLRSVARLVKGTVSGNDFRDITTEEMGYEYQGITITLLSGMAQNPTDKNDVLIMGSGGIFRTKDFGERWENISYYSATYNPHSFLGWHPQIPDTLFLTSESMIYVGTVYRSTDDGKTWDEFAPDANSESSCHCIAFDPDDANHLLISGEYAIYESFDCGETWETAYNDSNQAQYILGYSYNIFYDPADNSTVYAVGHGNGDPTRNIVKSTDKGKTWQQCMTYDFENYYSFFYDAALFDGKIWIYDYKDIIYWSINGYSDIEDTNRKDLQPTIYYDINGIRHDRKPSTGIVIEKRGETTKVTM